LRQRITSFFDLITSKEPCNSEGAVKLLSIRWKHRREGWPVRRPRRGGSLARQRSRAAAGRCCGRFSFPLSSWEPLFSRRCSLSHPVSSAVCLKLVSFLRSSGRTEVSNRKYGTPRAAQTGRLRFRHVTPIRMLGSNGPTPPRNVVESPRGIEGDRVDLSPMCKHWWPPHHRSLGRRVGSARAAGSIGVIGSVGMWTSRAPSQRHLIVRRMWS
jgi:hypothetical protein